MGRRRGDDLSLVRATRESFGFRSGSPPLALSAIAPSETIAYDGAHGEGLELPAGDPASFDSRGALELLNRSGWSTGCLFVAWFATAGVSTLRAQDAVINEFLAVNGGSVRDEDGDASDWIEIHNRSELAVDLADWSLTDDRTVPDKWLFPRVTLAEGAYLVVFASAKHRRGESGPQLHTNFRLDQRGEFLGLFRPTPGGEREAVSAFSPGYPEQRAGRSYGRDANDAGSYFATPTPGSANGDGFEGFVADPQMTPPRGFYDESLRVAISSATPGATVVYTLDGSPPTLENAVEYSEPLDIEGRPERPAAILRARAFRDDLLSSRLVTHTYVYPAVVASQTNAALPGTPRMWAGRPADFEVDPEVTSDPRYRETFVDDLLSIPTMSMVADPADLFSETTGIYANASRTGRGSERPVSLEWLWPSGERRSGERGSFQQNAGARIHGGISRLPEYLKHTFRIYFRREYGAARLEFPLFEGSDIASFDQLVLRANVSDGWIQDPIGWSLASTYTRDPFARQTMRDMGHEQPLDTYVHLYVNGAYWGLYNPVEHATAGFASEHFGGEKEEWDVIKHVNFNSSRVVDGNREAWDRAMGLAAADVRQLDAYAAVTAMVDVVDLTDYLLLNMYIGNWDWPQNNWYAARHRVPDGRFRFFSWDAETSLEPGNGTLSDVTFNQTNPTSGDTPGGFLARLRRSEEFVTLFGDRVEKHLSSGVLTPDANTERMRSIASRIDRAIVGESARWGDYGTTEGSRAAPRTRDDNWVPALEILYDNYLPSRHEIVRDQLTEAGLYPELNPPDFSRLGGAIDSQTSVLLLVPVGEIYYTLDGADPRSPGGGVNAEAILARSSPRALLPEHTEARVLVPQDASLGLDWTLPDFDDSSWIAGPNGRRLRHPRRFRHVDRNRRRRRDVPPAVVGLRARAVRDSRPVEGHAAVPPHEVRRRIRRLPERRAGRVGAGSRDAGVELEGAGKPRRQSGGRLRELRSGRRDRPPA